MATRRSSSTRSVSRTRPGLSPARWALLLLAATAVALVAAILRYNDPDDTAAGLSDDHFYYAIRGWQMRLGEWPDRDYVDAGAPLAYAISAALRLASSYGVWPEYTFSTLALALGAGLTCLAAARASNSTVLGALAALFQMALAPRLYNYPKILVYAAAIPLIWFWIDAPRRGRTWLLAGVTAIAFLLRHDHGLYVAGAFGLALLTTRTIPWRETLRHGATYVVATLLLLAPYLGYLQVNGGIVTHLETGYRWSVRDRDRAPLVLPDFDWRGSSAAAPVDAPASEWWNQPPFPELARHRPWWLFWVAVLLPVVSALLLALRPRAAMRWPSEPAKIGIVVVLGLALDQGFLRGNLPVRIPDVSVPIAILGAWAVMTVGRTVRAGYLELLGRTWQMPTLVRLAVPPLTLAVLLITLLVQMPTLRERVEGSSLLHGPEGIRGDAVAVTAGLGHVWELERWGTTSPRADVQLARYVAACSAPDDRVLVTPYLPAVAGLAQRGFAGGQGDLRPGFMADDDEQALTLARLRGQAVPIVIGPPPAEWDGFRRSFPAIGAWIERNYVNHGARRFDDGVEVTLLTARDRQPTRTWTRLDAPCFR